MANFETATCSRCGGEGKYSFNGQHSICYKCGGPGVVLSKRGQAANDFYVALASKPWADIQVGDVVRVREMNAVYWRKVTAISDAYNGGKDFSLANVKTGEQACSFGFTPAYVPGPVQVYGTPEQRESWLAEALAYQASLTKSGTPAKRR